MRGNTIEMQLIRGKINLASLLYQYDYGQVLILTGVELPVAYEVHFSNSENGISKTSIGNSDGVVIPDEFLTSGEDIYVWLFLHQGNDDGETEYKGIIPVKKRSRPTDIEPTPVQQDVITQTIAALNEAVEQTGQDAAAATSAKNAAETAQGKAETAQRKAETAQVKAEEARNAAQTAQRASEGARDRAETSQGEAEQARDRAIEEAGNAANSAASAYRDAERAEQAAGEAGYMFIAIDENGHLIYTRTRNVDVDFELDENGHLVMEVI